MYSLHSLIIVQRFSDLKRSLDQLKKTKPGKLCFL